MSPWADQGKRNAAAIVATAVMAGETKPGTEPGIGYRFTAGKD